MEDAVLDVDMNISFYFKRSEGKNAVSSVVILLTIICVQMFPSLPSCVPGSYHTDYVGVSLKALWQRALA